MEIFALVGFLVILLLSIILQFNLLYALVGGLIIFLVYAALRGFSAREMLSMVIGGILKAKNILLTFILIGMLTGLWRASGTIPSIIAYASAIIRPSLLLVMTFLLNAMVSFLIGTSFGTGATMGVICAAMGTAMGISPILIGGAILSGAFWGDRCSPVSTSMLLVSELTGTDPFDNIKTMFRTGLIPTILTFVVFLVVGFTTTTSGDILDFNSLFASEFRLHIITLLPALAILALSAMRVKVRKAMTVSILVAIPICIFLQGNTIVDVFKTMLLGFHAEGQEVASLLDGGGIISMVRIAAIVCLSSSYAGIFEKTGLLTSLKDKIASLEKKTNSFLAITVTSAITAMAACNQTLSIMLTEQLVSGIVEDKKKLASILEDTVVVIAPLVPWSIAGSTVLYTCGLPLSAIAAACFLYILPICGLIKSLIKKDKEKQLKK